jgi:hypothetical protein
MHLQLCIKLKNKRAVISVTAARGPQSAGQTECQPMGAAQTSGFKSTRFSRFWKLKKALKGRVFTSDDNVKEAVVQWFRPQPKEFFADGIRRLAHHWDTRRDACSVF